MHRANKSSVWLSLMHGANKWSVWLSFMHVANKSSVWLSLMHGANKWSVWLSFMHVANKSSVWLSFMHGANKWSVYLWCTVQTSDVFDYLWCTVQTWRLFLSIIISTSLHVSRNYVPVIRRTYCICATLVFFTVYGWLSGLLVGMRLEVVCT